LQTPTGVLKLFVTFGSFYYHRFYSFHILFPR